jgi:hypothetical protein
MQRRIRTIATAVATAAAAAVLSLSMTSTSWAATGFSATSINGSAPASALFTTHAVSAGEHLVCGGHPANVTSVSPDGNGSVFHVSPFLQGVHGGQAVTCIAA